MTNEALIPKFQMVKVRPRLRLGHSCFIRHSSFVICHSLLIIWYLALMLGSGPADAASPDVLLIMPDQMRGDCLSALNHPVVRTPTLDKLASDGALFRRAYTTCPSCIPARFS